MSKKYEHDPLCSQDSFGVSLDGHKCFGCWLVDLRSEATYASSPRARLEARDHMERALRMIQAHLYDVLEMSTEV